MSVTKAERRLWRKHNPGLAKKEDEEWRSLQAKSKRHNVPVRRLGVASVSFGKGVSALLGTGKAITIMDARIRRKKMKKAIRTRRLKTFVQNGKRYRVVYSVSTKGIAQKARKMYDNRITALHHDLKEGRWLVGVR